MQRRDVLSTSWRLYIEDIYSFAVNTINIVIEWNENISILKKNWMFSLHEMKIL